MSITGVFSAITEILAVIWSVFGNCASTIMGNPLLFVPVLLSCAAGIIYFAIRVVRKLGIRGVSSGGKKRRRG